MEDDNFFGEIISKYTRKEAIEDGVLVDVSDMAKEAGFIIPVAITIQVYNQYVEIPPGIPLQDKNGRLWDILWMLRLAVYRQDASTINYKLYVRNNRDHLTLVTLKSVMGPDEDGYPCLTIMLPDES